LPRATKVDRDGQTDCPIDRGVTMIEAQVSRRDVLKFSALGAGALALPVERVVRAATVSQIPASKLPAPYTLPFEVPPVIDARSGGTVALEQTASQLAIIPGYRTTVFGYNEPGRPAITPGPTIHVARGTPIVVTHKNRLNEFLKEAPRPSFAKYDPWTSTHLHGSASAPQYDGYASDITKIGQTKTYKYPNKQDARTLWYHDHGVHHTAENAYMGLAAQYHLHDQTEAKLPKWVFGKEPFTPAQNPADRILQQFDVPLTLVDKMFGTDGQFRYDDSGHSGLWGDVVLVNGVPWPTVKVYARKYRFRVLNASISRGYRLQLSTGDPMLVVGTDGGLVPVVQQTTQLRCAMAERYEVVIDFAKYRGKKIQLLNLGVPNSTNYDHTGKIMQFEVVADENFDKSDNDIAAGMELNTSDDVKDLWGLKEAGAQTVKLEVIRQNGMWKIESTDEKGVRKRMTWEDIIASGYKETIAKSALGGVQVWEMTNKSGGWFHPVHIHLVDFKILSRNGKAPFNYELGPKDVAYVGENETVRAIMRFGKEGEFENAGRYMVHCHNLPHEDHDMMTQFEVVGPNGEGAANDPMTADPAK
jgi:FtsP/CotA-like multicopper oxidase with cupredoxin domain